MLKACYATLNHGNIPYSNNKIDVPHSDCNQDADRGQDQDTSHFDKLELGIQRKWVVLMSCCHGFCGNWSRDKEHAREAANPNNNADTKTRMGEKKVHVPGSSNKGPEEKGEGMASYEWLKQVSFTPWFVSYKESLMENVVREDVHV